MKTVLIIEDDAYLREELAHTLCKEGYSATSISSFPIDGAEIINAQPDLVLLDLNLPGKSGFELCRYLRQKKAFPILVLTARDQLADELQALNLGADDFLTKPCYPKRLVARVERLIALYRKIGNSIEVGRLSLDPDTFKVSFDANHRVLSETEGRLLQCFMTSHPNLVTKEVLFQTLWGGPEYVDENILHVNITRLRKSLEAVGAVDVIKTRWGVGYYLEVKG